MRERERDNEHSFSLLKKGKGVIMDVDRRPLSVRGTQFRLSSLALISSSSPIFPHPPNPTHPTVPTSCPLHLSPPHLLPHSLSLPPPLPPPHASTSHLCVCFPLHLFFIHCSSPPVFLHSSTFSLQKSCARIYISSAVIDIFHLPASFPIGCLPASPRQQR